MPLVIAVASSPRSIRPSDRFVPGSIRSTENVIGLAEAASPSTISISRKPNRAAASKSAISKPTVPQTVAPVIKKASSSGAPACARSAKSIPKVKSRAISPLKLASVLTSKSASPSDRPSANAMVSWNSTVSCPKPRSKVSSPFAYFSPMSDRSRPSSAASTTVSSWAERKLAVPLTPEVSGSMILPLKASTMLRISSRASCTNGRSIPNRDESS